MMDTSMEQAKGLSVSEYERDLGTSALNLYQLLSDYDARLSKIDSYYNGEKLRIEREYKSAQNEAKDAHERAKTKAKQQYDSDVNSVNYNFESRKTDEEKQYYTNKENHSKANRSLRERNEARIQELTNLESAWRTYIDKVHLAFDSAVDQAKKDQTERIRKEYEALLYLTNQKALGEKGKVSYDHESPFWYALRHPYEDEPVALNGVRTVALIIAILCIFVIVGTCMWDAYQYYDNSEAYASNLVRFLLYGVLGYLVIEFIWCYFSTFAWVRDKNAFKKSQRERDNDFILKEKANAANRMSNFQNKYKPIYFVNGRWDFDWRRYPMKREEADVILNNIRSTYRSTMPRTSDGILPYAFEINYNALNPLS